MDDRRTYIAAMCLQGIVGSTDEGGTPLATPCDAAILAINYADALLARLEETPPPARTKDPAPPPDPGNGGTGEPEGAASPHAAEDGRQGGGASRAVHAHVETVGPDPTSPVNVWDCEARFDNDPVCPGPAQYDPVTRGRFCGLHLSVPELNRREFHRLHGDRNRPARLAGRIADAV